MKPKPDAWVAPPQPGGAHYEFTPVDVYNQTEITYKKVVRKWGMYVALVTSALGLGFCIGWIARGDRYDSR